MNLNQFVPDNQKNEEYHRKMVETIIRGSLNTTFNLNYITMNECANFFQSQHTGDEFQFLQVSEDGEALPAKWMDLNRIRTKLNIVLGEFMERGYDIEVRALNKEAVSRRLREKDRLLVEMRLKPVAAALTEATQLPFDIDPNAPDDEEALEEFIQFNYKDTCEFVVESALKWLSQKFNWTYLRYALFRDILIFGRCFARVELIDGLPVPRRVDPRMIIFDTNATDDYLSDSTYWGEVRYMNIGDCVEQFGLSKAEIEQIVVGSNNTPTTSSFVSSLQKDLLLSPDNKIQFTKTDQGGLRVLVCTAYWVDTKPWNYKVGVDKYGNEHLKRTNKSGGDGVIKKRVKIWRKATLIGGKILKDWGEAENQVRSVDNYYDTQPPYLACIPNFINGTSLSMTQQMRPAQNLKNIVAYNMQLALARAGAKGITIDVSQIPEGFDIDQVIKYLKVVGVNLIDSKRDGIPAAYNQFQTYDMTISDSIVRYIEIMTMLDREMDAITGINEARQGLVQGASQTVGVTQSALFQSNLATAPLFKLFRGFASNLFTQQAGLIKIAWAAKEKYAPIIGDTGIDFLTTDVDVDLHDYGVFIYEVPPMLDDLSNFKQFVLAALQSGAVGFIDALDLLSERDVKVGIRRLKKALARKEREAALRAEMEQQAQLHAADEAKQADAMKQAMFFEQQQQLQREKQAHELRKIAAEGLVDLKKKKLDAMLNL